MGAALPIPNLSARKKLAQDMQLSQDQAEAFDGTVTFLLGREKFRTLIGPAGSGKCLAPDVEIAMADGTVRQADDIRVGDVLLGDDGTTRTVLARRDGISPLYRIKPTRKGYDEWVCNDQHILTLVASYSQGPFEKGHVYDMGMQEYLSLSKSHKHLLKQFSVGYDGWGDVDFPIDPYMVGVWLGDGSTASPIIWNVDQEVVDYVYEFGAAVGMDISVRASDTSCPGYAIVNEKGKPNPVLDALREFGAGVEKTIPPKYLRSSREQRLRLLAGLLDTDGYLSGTSLEIAQKSVPLADAICFLARSLGLRVHRRVKEAMGHSYQAMLISGDMSEVPFRVPRRVPANPKPNRDPLRSGFTVEPAGTGRYVGLVVDGNKRFLKSDFTVVHNTTLMREIVREAKKRRWKIKLSAPTHKAAAQLTEATGRKAQTIHRILGVKVKESKTERRRYLEIEKDTQLEDGVLLVIDEASMLSGELLQLIRATAEHIDCKVLFIGDRAQLNPVGELPCIAVDPRHCPWQVMELTTIHRQAAGNPIIRAATRIRESEDLVLLEDDNDGERGIFVLPDTREWAALMIERCAESEQTNDRYIGYTNEAVDFAAKAIRQTRFGAEARHPYLPGELLVVNERYEYQVPDPAKKRGFRKETVENNTEIVVERVTRDGDRYVVTATVDGRSVEFQAFANYQQRIAHLNRLAAKARKTRDWREFWGEANGIADLRSAATMTIHKSQGSTFRDVFLNMRQIRMFDDDRERQRAFYVAVTRASRAVYVTGVDS